MEVCGMQNLVGLMSLSLDSILIFSLNPAPRPDRYSDVNW